MSAPLNRRAALARIAGGAALALPGAAIAAVPAESDAEVIALAADIVRRATEAEVFQEMRIEITQQRFDALMGDTSKSVTVRWNEACAFSRDSGRNAAIDELNVFEGVTDRLFERLMAIPATTQPGRAAKVRALLCHVMRSAWRGPSERLDWDKDMARALLGEFAGMSAEELADV